MKHNQMLDSRLKCLLARVQFCSVNVLKGNHRKVQFCAVVNVSHSSLLRKVMDLVNMSLKLVEAIVEHAARAVANTEDCKLLASLTKQTKPFLQTLEQNPVEDLTLQTALNLVFDALKEADQVIETCCRSTRLTRMLCAPINSQMLERAAQKLEHALQQVPFDRLQVASEIHEGLLSLREDLRRAKFDSAAASSHQARMLKEEMEKAFDQYLKGTEKMKSIVVETMTKHSKSINDRLQDVDVLKDYVRQAQKDKDERQEFALQQIINVISESIQQNEAASSAEVADVVHDQLRCPISAGVVKDPGMTYEGDSISKRPEKGKTEDSVTTKEIKSGEPIPNRLVKTMMGPAFGIEGAADRQTEKKESLSLEAGLYEGHGQHKRPDGTVESAYLLLCLDPDGNVQGYVITEAEDSDAEQQSLIVQGKWETSSPSMSFTSVHVKYEGTIFVASSPKKAFRFVGTATSGSSPAHRFEYPHLAPPPLQHHFLLRSGLLEMKGIIIGANGEEYQSKMLLSLKKGSSLRGWLTIEDSSGSIRTGNVLSGGWELNGVMHLFLYFPRTASEPLDSASSPSKYLARYKLSGHLSVGDHAGHRQCTTYEGTWKITGPEGDTASDTTYPTLIGGLETSGKYCYHCSRTPSGRLSAPLRNRMTPLLLPNERGKHTEFSPPLCHLRVAVRIIYPGLKKFHSMGMLFFTSHRTKGFMDKRDASTVFAFWHHDRRLALTMCLEATDFPNEFFIKIHKQPHLKYEEPRAGSYLTVLPRTFKEQINDAHYCCFVPPERLPLF